MAEETLAERAEKKNSSSNPHLAGAVAVLAVALFLGWWLLGRDGGQTGGEKPTQEIAVVRVDTLLKAHRSWEKLKRLKDERQAIAAELDAEKSLRLSLLAPQAAERPFAEAVKQKKTQKSITAYGEMMEELKKAEQKKRKELAPAWEKEKKEINDKYLNDIFNIRLKLDNADVMRLKKEQIEALQEKMKKLQHERGGLQYELNRKYEGMISDYVAALAAERGLEISGELSAFEGDVRNQEMRKRSAAQKRNVEEIQKNLLKSIERQQKIISATADLKAKDTEITVVEGRMLEDIAAKASKLAVMRHLAVVLAVSEEKTVKKGEATFPTVMNIGANDLTKELLQELHR